jgi:hypothetical protein
MYQRISRLLTAILIVSVAFAAISPTSALAQTATESQTIHSVRMEVFIRSDLQSSRDAAQFARDLASQTSGLDVVVHDVLKDRPALSHLYQLSKQAGRDKPVVPAFYCCKKIYFGFLGAEQSGPAIRKLMTVDVYTRSTCVRCQTAKVFLNQLQRRWPAVQFNVMEITGDEAARARWQALSRAAGGVPGLPTFDFAGRVIVGYDGDDTTGKQLESWIANVAGAEEKADQGTAVPPGWIPFAWPSLLFSVAATPREAAWQAPVEQAPVEQETVEKKNAQPSGQHASEDAEPDSGDLMLPGEAEFEDVGIAVTEPVKSTVPRKKDTIRLPLFGELRVSDVGLPAFTLAVGLVDGFNPCAMWILVFLLSILVNIKDRRKIVLIAGSFVVVSGVAYFAFMAAWLNLFILIGLVRPIQVFLGLIAVFIGVINIKDFIAFKKGISLSIPESSKPGLYRRVRQIVNAKYLSAAIAGAVALAVVVNIVELLCTAGLPAMYTQILMMQDRPSWHNYGYLALYNVAYMFDDTVLLGIAVVTLSNRKMQEREGRWLKLLSGVVILILGIVMILFPEWLAFTE